jgi:hypothetical protein
MKLRAHFELECEVSDYRNSTVGGNLHYTNNVDECGVHYIVLKCYNFLLLFDIFTIPICKSHSSLRASIALLLVKIFILHKKL